MTEKDYNPKEYWGNLVSGNTDLSHVGHETLGSYNRYAYWFRLRALKIALRMLDFEKIKIFEAAYGEGFYLNFWRQAGATDVSGLDISEAACSAAKKRFPNFDLKLGDLSDEAHFTKESSYDLVTAIDVLYHIVDDQLWEKALINLTSLVKKDGFFLFTEKFSKDADFQNMPIVKRRAVSTWEKVLHEQGFVRKRLQPVFMFMDDPITFGEHSWLGKLSAIHWRVFTKLIRMASFNRTIQDVVCFLCAFFQCLPELALINTLKRVPNLELMVYQRT